MRAIQRDEKFETRLIMRLPIEIVDKIMEMANYSFEEELKPFNYIINKELTKSHLKRTKYFDINISEDSTKLASLPLYNPTFYPYCEWIVKLTLNFYVAEQLKLLPFRRMIVLRKLSILMVIGDTLPILRNLKRENQSIKKILISAETFENQYLTFLANWPELECIHLFANQINPEILSEPLLNVQELNLRETAHLNQESLDTLARFFPNTKRISLYCRDMTPDFKEFKNLTALGCQRCSGTPDELSEILFKGTSLDFVLPRQKLSLAHFRFTSYLSFETFSTCLDFLRAKCGKYSLCLRLNDELEVFSIESEPPIHCDLQFDYYEINNEFIIVNEEFGHEDVTIIAPLVLLVRNMYQIQRYKNIAILLIEKILSMNSSYVLNFGNNLLMPV
eukprot:NODE_12_length_54577_cov_0.384100.p11 type:complete len:392 gc:universal NODE_12_length_54577_cov_0.384100:3976-2801(-)